MRAGCLQISVNDGLSRMHVASKMAVSDVTCNLSITGFSLLFETDFFKNKKDPYHIPFNSQLWVETAAGGLLVVPTAHSACRDEYSCKVTSARASTAFVESTPGVLWSISRVTYLALTGGSQRKVIKAPVLNWDAVAGEPHCWFL